VQFECSKWCIIEGNVNVPASLVHREAVFRSTFFLHATLRSLTSWWPTSPLPFPSLKFQSCYFSPCQLTCTIYFIYILLFVNIFFSCPQLSLGCCCLFVCVCVFFFNYYYFESSASCITCFSTHSAQTWVPFCFDQRSSLDHPIFVSVLSSVLALTHQPWWWGQQFPLKYQYMSARLHGIHAKTNVFGKYFICTLYVLKIFLHSHVMCESVHSAIRRNT